MQSTLTGFFLGVALTFLTAASDASLLPGALAYSFCCLDDRALRRHIHSIPPQYLREGNIILERKYPKALDFSWIIAGVPEVNYRDEFCRAGARSKWHDRTHVAAHLIRSHQ